MSLKIAPIVRQETPADWPAVRDVHRAAFGQKDEARLVDELRAAGCTRVSLVAEIGGNVVGHILFSEVRILTGRESIPAVSLAPMAVRPEWQKQGIGSALVRAGQDACRQAGEGMVFVLGHAEYYPRFGFSPAVAEPFQCPYGGGSSWMALELTPGAAPATGGWIQYPPPFARFPPQMTLEVLAGLFAVCRLPAGSAIPDWAVRGDVFSVTRTRDELSVVCRQDEVPAGVACEADWQCLRAAGALPLSAVGILASLAKPLAEAGISLFAVSTYDTDYLLVKASQLDRAVEALAAAGHEVRGEG
jgi:putative acetyltransferase